jgi:hypothetical protein
VLKNGLLPSLHQAQLSSLQSLLESGIPAVRNKSGGHGQGGTITEPPEHLVSYALHLTAATILLLIQAERTQ